MYRDYYISSLKIEYRPSIIDSGNAGSYKIDPMICGTAMDTFIGGGAPTALN